LLFAASIAFARIAGSFDAASRFSASRPGLPKSNASAFQSKVSAVVFPDSSRAT